jgi:hypothetical protein
MEQEFTMRRLQDLLPEADKKDIITVLISLQHQNYCLANTLKNLLKHWNSPPANSVFSEDTLK